MGAGMVYGSYRSELAAEAQKATASTSEGIQNGSVRTQGTDRSYCKPANGARERIEDFVVLSWSEWYERTEIPVAVVAGLTECYCPSTCIGVIPVAPHEHLVHCGDLENIDFSGSGVDR